MNDACLHRNVFRHVEENSVTSFWKIPSFVTARLHSFHHERGSAFTLARHTPLRQDFAMVSFVHVVTKLRLFKTFDWLCRHQLRVILQLLVLVADR